MFLFTNRAASEARSKPAETVPFAQPLRQAAQSTGVSFEYLTKTAEKESGFRPDAKAGTSSATGMFQFIEQTWLATLKAEGPKVGLAREAAQIDVAKGKFTVADPAQRQRIMALREDPATAAMMAGAFAARNGQKLKQTLGRNPSDGDLYLAHFLGPAGAADFLALRESNPQASAAAAFPDAASANRNVFFDPAGKARSVEQVFERMTEGFSRAAAARATGGSSSDLQQQAATAAAGLFKAKPEATQMHGLFRSSGEPVAAPVSQMFTGLSRFAKKDAASREELARPLTAPASSFQALPNAPSQAARALPSPAEVTGRNSGTSVRSALSAERPSESRVPATKPLDTRAAESRPADAKPLDLMRFVKF